MKCIVHANFIPICMASEVKRPPRSFFDLRIELPAQRNDTVDTQTHIAYKQKVQPREVKRPPRSFLTAELNSSTPKTYGWISILPYNEAWVTY